MLIDRTVRVAHGQAARLRQRRRIEEAQRRRAVAHDQPRAVVRDPPAFAGIGPPLRLLERAQVVDEPDLRPPRQLDNLSLPLGNPLAEVVARERLRPEHLPGLDLHLADARPSVQSGAFIEHAVAVDEPGDPAHG